MKRKPSALQREIGPCVEWRGTRSTHGYGRVMHGGRMQQAHRVKWEKHRGAIPNGLVVCHHCDNPPCVRLSHLFLGTQGDNIRDAASKGRLAQQLNPDLYAKGSLNLKTTFGAENPNSKLTDRQVVRIRSLYASGVNGKILAPRFGVSDVLIYQIVNRKIWAHI